MKMKEKKNGKREEKTKQRLLIVCLFSLPCCTWGHWRSGGKKLVRHVSKEVGNKTAPSAIKACSLLPVCCTLSGKKKKSSPKADALPLQHQRGGNKTSHCEHAPLFWTYVSIMSQDRYTTKNDSHLILFGLALCLQATLPLTCGFINILTRRKNECTGWQYLSNHNI